MAVRTTLINLIREQIGEPETGAEIGVYKAETSKALLKAFPKLYLNLIDPWKEWEEGASYRKHRRTGRLTQEQWDEVYNIALNNVFIYIMKRCRIYRMTSEEAAPTIKDNSLDFCFLDGDHGYKNVKQDIDLWKPKIRKGGLFVFHDFGGSYHGVRKAVLEVFEEDDLILRRDRICGVVI